MSMIDQLQPWGIAFEPGELQEALDLAEAIGLPYNLAEEHAGSPEVIEVPPRNDGPDCCVQFMIWREADNSGTSVVECPSYQTQSFPDLLQAVSFVRARRGTDWPSVA